MSRSAEYWEKSVPWTFRDEHLPYEKRRSMRYSLQDYMAETIGFDRFGSKLVLEIGSGSGIDSAEFARHGAEVVSLDFTKNGTKGTRDLFHEAGLASNVVRASASRLPLQEGKFDCVYSFGVLHHIPQVDEVLQDLASVLKPGGTFIAMFYNARSLLYAYSILFLHRDEGLREDDLIREYGERVAGCPYSKAYTTDELLKLLTPYFEDIKMEVRYNVIDVAGERKVKLGLSDDHELGWHIIVKARKNGQSPS